MADGTLTVVAQPHALKHDTVYAEFKAGQTLAEILGADPERLLRVTVGGFEAPHAFWSKLRPKAGTLVNVQVTMQGGNGGKLLRTVALIAVAVIAWEVAPYLVGEFGVFAGMSATLVAAGLTMIGTLVVNALLPPPQPKKPNYGNDWNRLNSFTGTGNQAGPYNPIPIVLGEAQFFPPHAVLPYVIQLGNDQYLRMMLDMGSGDVAVSNINIGNTPIADYTDVQQQISTSPTLFSDSVYEASLSNTLSDRQNAINTTSAATDQISLDFQFDGGLFGIDSNGHTTTPTASVFIEYSLSGQNAWQSAAVASGLTISNGACSVQNYNQDSVFTQGDVAGKAFYCVGGSRGGLRIGVQWNVPNGQYDVRLTRYGVDWAGSAAGEMVGQTTTWTTLRSIRYTNPSTTGTVKLALSIQATDQLNQTIGNLSVFAQQLIPVYNSSTKTWSAPQVSTNPGWIYYWLLTGCPAFKRLVDPSRVDLTQIAAFAAMCDTYGLSCKGVLDSTSTAFDVIKQVLACGLGTFAMRDGLYSVVWDEQQTTPVQMFTPANSWKFQGSRVFTTIPDALRVRFVNPEANWQDDELVVYAPGQNASTASKYETLETKFVADPNVAWRIGTYHLSVGTNRPNTYTFYADVENIVCTRGDLIVVAHDVTEWGTGWGRVQSINVSGSTTITLDNEVTLAAGTSYSLRARDSSGNQFVGAITTGAGTTNTLTVSTALSTVAPDDLCVVGQSNSETARLIVTKITPGADLSAMITAVDEAPAVYSSWTGAPPAFTSQITGQVWEAPPPAPIINAVFSYQTQSTFGDGGTTRPVINAGINWPSGRIGAGSLNGLRYRFERL